MTWNNHLFYNVENALSNSLLEDLVFKASSLPKQVGSAPAGRNTQVAALNPTVFQNVYDIIQDKVQEINQEIFQLDLTGIEPMEFAEYTTGSYYNWHADIGTDYNVDRKLSFVLQLSTAESYAGGDHQFFLGSLDPVSASRNFNSLTVFPSTNWTRVTEVTSGQRLCLSGWLTGPKFR